MVVFTFAPTIGRNTLTTRVVPVAVSRDGSTGPLVCLCGGQNKRVPAACVTMSNPTLDPVGVPHIEINGKVWGMNSARTEAGLIKALCATGIKVLPHRLFTVFVCVCLASYV